MDGAGVEHSHDPKDPKEAQEGGGDETAEMGVKGQNTLVRKQRVTGALHFAFDGFQFGTEDVVRATVHAHIVDKEKALLWGLSV